ncbi:hypothetical protein A2165_01525 [Candidatus Curtissbacteria bacterium RBG_13_40_7]|uniref:Uncharacterized protein n=1 Tax=Candidatus Curtissbacteria bacterium RBG_13_40_7 TaxID=1797706 RepID=A0A1F5FTR2_9BACT|nr:MAG: hypothetical protein A2165_01525 [Candidatus Curtissbacteria bacterium RBG_13_40_7]
MEKVDYNIEYAHIYSDEVFNQEHIESLNVLELILRILKNDNKIFNLNLLVDEYHPDTKSLDIDDFLSKLKYRGYYPDNLYLESELHKDVKLLLDNLTSEKALRDYERYLVKHGKSPCSYLVASWYLKRLGVLPIENIKSFSNGDNPFAGQRIINILDKKYKANEDKALELIKNSKFAEYLDNIIYYYY